MTPKTLLHRNKEQRTLIALMVLSGLLAVLFLKQLVYADSSAVRLYFDSGSALQKIERISRDAQYFKVRVTDFENQPVQGAEVSWNVDDQERNLYFDKITDRDGYSYAQVVNSLPGAFLLTASFEEQLASYEVLDEPSYIFKPGSLQTDEKYNKQKWAEANGVDVVTCTINIIDQKTGEPVAGGKVLWRTMLKGKEFSSDSSWQESISDDKGMALLRVESSEAGIMKVMAKVPDDQGEGTSTAERSEHNSATVDIEYVKNYDLGLKKLTTSEHYASVDVTETVTVIASLEEVGYQTEGYEIFWQLHDLDNTGAILIDGKRSKIGYGQATVDVRAQRSGRVGVTATVYDPDDPMRVERKKTYFSFKRMSDLKPLRMSDNKVQAEANGVDEVILIARLLDEYGEVHKGRKITWRLSDNAAKAYVSQPVTITDDLGEANISVRANQAGTLTVIAAVADEPDVAVQSKSIAFVKNYNVGLKSLSLNKTIAKGNSEEAITATAKLFNQGANKNTTVRWSLKNNDIKAQLLATESEVNGKGEAVTGIMADIEGYVTLLATVVNQDDLTQQESLQVEAYFQNQAAIKALTVTDKQVEGGEQYRLLKADIVDDQGREQEGQRVAWVIQDDGGTQASFIDLPKEKISRSDVQGRATAKLKVNKSGVVTVLAKIIGQKRQQVAWQVKQKMIKVHFGQGVTKVNLIPSFDGVVDADGKENLVIKAQIMGVGNKEDMIRQRVQWRLLGKAQSGVELVGAFTEGQVSLTNTKGETEVRLKSTKAANIELEAKLLNDASQAGGRVVKSVLPVVFRQVGQIHSIKPDKERVALGETVRVTVKAVVNGGEPLANWPVYWQRNGVGSQPIAASSLTDDRGEAWVDYESKQAGPVLITAKINKTRSGKEQSQAAQLIHFGSDFRQISLVVDQKTQDASWTRAADNQEKVEITAQVLNQRGEPAKSIKVQWTALGANSFCAAKSLLTDEQGRAVLECTSPYSGMLKVKAVVPFNDGTVVESTLPRDIEFQAYNVEVRPMSGSLEQTLTATITEEIKLGVRIKTVSMHDRPERYVPNITKKHITYRWLFLGNQPKVTYVGEPNEQHDRLVLALSATEPMSNSIGIKALSEKNNTLELTQAIRFNPVNKLHAIEVGVNNVVPVAVKGIRVADGEDSVFVQVRALDEQGDPIKNARVSWLTQAESVGAVKEAGHTVTNSDGYAYAAYSSNTPGLFRARVKVTDADGKLVLWETMSEAVEFQGFGIVDFVPNRPFIIERVSQKTMVTIRLGTYSDHGRATQLIKNKEFEYYWSSDQHPSVEVFKRGASISLGLISDKPVSSILHVRALGAGARSDVYKKEIRFAP